MNCPSGFTTSFPLKKRIVYIYIDELDPKHPYNKLSFSIKAKGKSVMLIIIEVMKRRILNRRCALTSIILAISCTLGIPAESQTYPEYEGVYARLSDDSFIEIRRLTTTCPIAGVNGPGFTYYLDNLGTFRSMGVIGNASDVPCMSINDYLGLQVFAPLAIKSFVVNSKVMQFEFLEDAAVISQYFAGDSRNIQIVGEKYSPNIHFMMSTNWGYSRDSFKIKNISNFESEYTPESQDMLRETFTVNFERSKVSGSIPSYAFLIKLSGTNASPQYYAFATTRHLMNLATLPPGKQLFYDAKNEEIGNTALDVEKSKWGNRIANPMEY